MAPTRSFAERFGVDPDELAARVRDSRADARSEAVAAWEANPDDLHACWEYLHSHPAFEYHIGNGIPTSGFGETVTFEVVKVHPISRRIENGRRNTVTEVWVEAGPWRRPEDFTDDDIANGIAEAWPYGMPTHDPALDGGGDTFDAAIIGLARRVADTYGHDGRG